MTLKQKIGKSRKLTVTIAVGFAAIVFAIGAGYAIVSPSSSDGASDTGNAATFAQPGQSQQVDGQQVVGQIPENWRPGTGTIITGAAADKAKAVAVATYPEGTVNRVLQLSDGSYAVHRIGISGHHHIFVSKDFKVTGTS